METLFETAARVTAGIRPEPAVLVGGLAVRHHVGASARITHDVDLVCMTESGLDAARAHLVGEGYMLREHGHWVRAIGPVHGNPVIDVTRDPVVDVRTFEVAHIREPPVTLQVAQHQLQVAAPVDLVTLKLLAHRAQDLIDLVLLVTTGSVDPDRVLYHAELDDIERAVAAGAILARDGMRTGRLADAFVEALDRPMTAAESESFQRWLDAMERRGL